MNIATTAVAVAAGAALLAAASPATAEPQFQAALKSCNIGFMPVKPVVTGPPTVNILGTAFASCDVPPEVHHLELTLDRRLSGGWEVAARVTDDRIPQPGQRVTYQVKAPCTAGYWRLNVYVDGSLQGTPFHFNDHGMDRVVNEQDCNR